LRESRTDAKALTHGRWVGNSSHLISSKPA
jgi:hypothetical protein